MTTLAEENLAFIEKGKANFDEERTRIYAQAQRTIEATDILETALRVGDTAPMFTLPDAHGNEVSLAAVLEGGPAIVSFYRGAWCPFCNLELRALQREMEKISAAGVTLVAVSPNVPDASLELIDKHDLTFPVLSDAENVVAKQFNLVYTMDPALVDYYKNMDRNIDQMNGSAVWELPIPATYVIDQSGVIRFAFVDLNHRVRAEPADVVAIAADLAS